MSALRAVLCLALAALAGCAKPLSEVSWVPRYAPSRDDIPAAHACVGVARVLVTDGRADLNTLGVRYAEGAPARRFPITLAGSLASWAQSGLESGLQRAGLVLNAPGRPVLGVRVVRAEVQEEMANNAVFHATVRLEVNLAKDGRACFEGPVEGTSRGYGRPGNPENYEETTSEALDRALVALLNTQAFLDALCSGCGASAPAAP